MESDGSPKTSPVAGVAGRVGVFVGLATLDTVSRVPHHPAPNEKLTALRQDVAAGGPAANAAVAFAALGGQAILVTALGRHPFAQLAAMELASCGVRVIDVMTRTEALPPVSSIYVDDRTAERSVVSVNEVVDVAAPPGRLDEAMDGASVVLVDGHHPRLAVAAARLAADRGVPVVLDAGSWKPVLRELLPHVQIAACSADFRLPGVPKDEDALAGELMRDGPTSVLITHGADPVRWWDRSEGHGAVAVPAVRAADTLGAGDVFHGALAMATAVRPSATLASRIVTANAIAGLRCRHVGPRAWLSDPELAAWRERLVVAPIHPDDGAHSAGPKPNRTEGERGVR